MMIIERFHREPRPPVPLPDRPPFTAYVGNLPFDSNEDMIRDFFSGLPVSIYIFTLFSI
jgi:translation initiation factor 4B